jgi:hypothetical protein
MGSVANSKGFRYTTQPNYYRYDPTRLEIIRQANKQQTIQTPSTEPSRDNRYPAFAAPMADGRLVTDYRTHCYENIKVGEQYATKHWMQNNAEEMMDVSRRRQLEWSGGSLPILDLAPPPADMQYTNPDIFDIKETNYRGGLGLERADQTVANVPMPGTYFYAPSLAEERNNISKIRGTVNFEGGRNSPRGRIAPVQTNAPIFAPGNFTVVDRFAARAGSEATLTGQAVMM